MDKASVSDTGDCRFESCQGRPKLFNKKKWTAHLHSFWIHKEVETLSSSLLPFQSEFKVVETNASAGLSWVSMLQYTLLDEHYLVSKRVVRTFRIITLLLLHMANCCNKNVWIMKMNWKNAKEKIILGSTGIWTRDLLHPKQESYH